MTCHGAFWRCGRRFSRNRREKSATQRTRVVAAHCRLAASDSAGRASPRRIPVTAARILFLSRSPIVARRLLTTLHASQSIDPFLFVRARRDWPRDPGQPAERPGPAAQSLPAVRSAAEAALRRQLDPAVTGVMFEAAELDSRLRLAACPAPLAVNATLPRGTQSRVMVRVACKSSVYWTVNVPVDIHRKTDVLVMRRAVGRGENIARWRCAGAVPRVARPHLALHLEARGPRGPPDAPADPRRHGRDRRRARRRTPYT